MDQDEETWQAFEWAVRRKDSMWTTDRELLATATETQAAMLHVYLKVHGAKNLGKPMRITRPWERESKAEKIGMRAFTQMIRERR